MSWSLSRKGKAARNFRTKSFCSLSSSFFVIFLFIEKVNLLSMEKYQIDGSGKEKPLLIQSADVAQPGLMQNASLRSKEIIASRLADHGLSAAVLIQGYFRGHKCRPVLKCLKVSCASEFLCATPVAEPLCQGEPGVRERERRPKCGGLCSLRSHWSHQTGCQQFTATEAHGDPEWNCLDKVGIISGFYRDDPALSRRELSFDLKAWELGNLHFQALRLDTSPDKSWLALIYTGTRFHCLVARQNSLMHEHSMSIKS